MKKKILSLLAAFFMLFGTSAMAQVDSTLEGDVNGDGVVDIADITAVIAIIKQNAEANPTYYWYVGKDNPASMTDISPVVNDNTSPGWRLIGTSVPTYSSSKMLWNSANVIGLGGKVTWYLALPSKNIKVYSAGIDLTSDLLNYNGTQTINGVEYHIYTSIGTTRNLGYDIY